MVMAEKCLRFHQWIHKEESNFVRLWRKIEKVYLSGRRNWKDLAISFGWGYWIKNWEPLLRIEISGKGLEKPIFIWFA